MPTARCRQEAHANFAPRTESGPPARRLLLELELALSTKRPNGTGLPARLTTALTADLETWMRKEGDKLSRRNVTKAMYHMLKR